MQAPKPEMFQRSDSDAGVGDDDQSTVNKWPFNIRSTRSRVSRGASRGTVKPQARSALRPQVSSGLTIPTCLILFTTSLAFYPPKA